MNGKLKRLFIFQFFYMLPSYHHDIKSGKGSFTVIPSIITAHLTLNVRYLSVSEMGAPTYHRHYRFCAHNNQYSICMDIAVPYTSTVAVMASILAHNVSQSGGGGVLPEKLDRGVWPASQNPYPIYDQNLRFSLPYL